MKIFKRTDDIVQKIAGEILNMEYGVKLFENGKALFIEKGFKKTNYPTINANGAEYQFKSYLMTLYIEKEEFYKIQKDLYETLDRFENIVRNSNIKKPKYFTKSRTTFTNEKVQIEETRNFMLKYSQDYSNEFHWFVLEPSVCIKYRSDDVLPENMNWRIMSIFYDIRDCLLLSDNDFIDKLIGNHFRLSDHVDTNFIINYDDLTPRKIEFNLLGNPNKRCLERLFMNFWRRLKFSEITNFAITGPQLKKGEKPTESYCSSCKKLVFDEAYVNVKSSQAKLYCAICVHSAAFHISGEIYKVLTKYSIDDALNASNEPEKKKEIIRDIYNNNYRELENGDIIVGKYLITEYADNFLFKIEEIPDNLIVCKMSRKYYVPTI